MRARIAIHGATLGGDPMADELDFRWDNDTEPGSSEGLNWGLTDAERCVAPLKIAEYPIVRELGRGGQGVVYLAEDPKLGRPVALKVLSAALAPSTRDQLRFRREAETASRLDHPGICTIYGFGDHAGTPYIAMQFVEGDGLDAVIRRTRESQYGPPARIRSIGDDGGETLPASATARSDLLAVVELMESVARAVHHAHERGLVHRDIKPGNVMVAADGRPVVLDFGLARDEDSDGVTLTGTGDVLGTPAYMAPEQVVGSRGIDRRTDVHALGAMLFELLTLKRPFHAATREALYRKIERDSAPIASSINPVVPRDLDTVVAVALEKDPAHRYQTAEGLADDLRAVLEHRPISARDVPRLTRAARWARRHPATAALITAVTLSALILVGLFTFILARQPLVERAELQAERDRAEGAIERGFAASEAGRRNQAIVAFSEASVAGKLLPTAVAGIVVVHVRQKDLGLALDALDTHADVVRDSRGLQALRSFLVARNEGVDQIEVMRRSELDPVLAVDAFLLGTRDVTLAESGDTGRWKSALEFFEQAALRSPPRAIYYFRAVQAAGSCGDRARTDAFTSAILAQWPDKPSSYYWPAIALVALQEFDRAAELLETGRSKAPDDPRLHCVSGVIARLTGQPDKATAYLQEACRLAPNYSDPLLQLGLVAMGRGDFAEAVRRFKATIRIDPEQDDAYALMAESYMSLSQPELARDAMLAALEIDPYYAPFRSQLIDVLAELEDHEAIHEQARLLAQYTPSNVESLASEAFQRKLFGAVAAALVVLETRHPEHLPASPTLRLLGARAAAYAAAGQGKDDPALTEQDKTALRGHALRWLRADLASVRASRDAGSMGPATVRRRLLRPTRDPAFRSLRGDALNDLPDSAGEPWTAYWAELEQQIAALKN